MKEEKIHYYDRECVDGNCYIVPEGPDSIGAGDYDFLFNITRDVDSIQLSSSIRIIHNEAFKGCKSIDELKLNDGLETIGKEIIVDTNIKKLIIPASVVNIEGAFNESKNLKQVTFANRSKIKIIGSSSFSASGLESFICPISLEIIDEFAFFNCTKLKEIRFNESLLEIRKRACENSGIEALVIPSSVTKICDLSFFNCRNLQNLDFDDQSRLKSIGANAFANTKISFFKAPDSLNSIGEYAFANTKISFFKAPDSLNSIGEYAFSNNSVLEHVSFSENSKISEIGKGAFRNTGIKSFKSPPKLKEISNDLFSECKNLEEAELCEGIESINYLAFFDSGIKVIHMPDSLKKIEANAFLKCINLRYIICNDEKIDALKGILPEMLHEKILKKSCYKKAKIIIGNLVKNTNLYGDIRNFTGLPDELVYITMQYTDHLDPALKVNIPRNDVDAEWQEYKQKIEKALGINPNLNFLPASQLKPNYVKANSSHNPINTEEKNENGPKYKNI